MTVGQSGQRRPAQAVVEASALMSQRWRSLQHVMVSLTTIGYIAKTALVLVQFEHMTIS